MGWSALRAKQATSADAYKHLPWLFSVSAQREYGVLGEVAFNDDHFAAGSA